MGPRQQAHKGTPIKDPCGAPLYLRFGCMCLRFSDSSRGSANPFRDHCFGTSMDPLRYRLRKLQSTAIIAMQLRHEITATWENTGEKVLRCYRVSLMCCTQSLSYMLQCLQGTVKSLKGVVVSLQCTIQSSLCTEFLSQAMQSLPKVQ